MSALHKINDALDALAIARDIAELLFQAGAGQSEGHIVRGASLTQEYLDKAVALLSEVTNEMRGEGAG
jgi:hypothetical protein